MRIAFITDLHIDKAFEYPFGIDCRENFQRILKAILKTDASHLIIGGDLCFREIYEWIFEELSAFPLTYDVIAGNHDDSKMMCAAAGTEALLTGSELYYAKKFGHYLAVFLDSSKKELSRLQLKWLDRQLHQHQNNVLIFVHHPPFKAGVPYMDKAHAMQNGAEMMKLIHKYDFNIPIFTGHYHVEKMAVSKNGVLCITPSCFFQVDQNKEEFKVDHHRIAYRLIDLEKEVFKTSVHYIAGSRQLDV